MVEPIAVRDARVAPVLIPSQGRSAHAKAGGILAGRFLIAHLDFVHGVQGPPAPWLARRVRGFARSLYREVSGFGCFGGGVHGTTIHYFYAGRCKFVTKAGEGKTALDQGGVLTSTLFCSTLTHNT